MTKDFRKACEAGLACCNDQRQIIEFLEELVKVEPAWAERVAELRSKLNHTSDVSEAGIHIMDSMSE